MFAPARKHLRQMLAAAGLALLAGGAFYYFSPPVFYARAAVRVEEGSSAEQVRALARELTQPQILERTAGRLGVKATATDLRKNFLFHLTARPVAERELEVEVWCFSKDWAARWTPALLAELADFREIRRRKETLDTIKTLNREMTEIAAKLGNAGTLKFYATDRAGLTMGLDELTRLRAFTRERARVAQRLEEMERVRADLQDAEFPLVEKLSLIAAVDESAARESGERAAPPWEAIEKRRREVAAQLASASPADEAALLALHAQAGELDRKLQAEFDAEYRRFDVDYRNLTDQKTALEAKATERTGAGDSALNARFNHLAERIAAVDRPGSEAAVPAAYAGLRQMKEKPVAPDPLKIALCSLLGGGLLAFAAPFFTEWLGWGRAKAARLESALRLPALGSIPTRVEAPLSSAAFHGLRDRLLAAGAPRVLMVASALPAEGRTTVAANLARAFAEGGARVLLIDTDLRRGRLHRLFGFRKAPGLSDLLRGEIAPGHVVRRTPHERLCVLNAGTTAMDGAKLLDSAAFAAAISSLRENHDFLVLDTPPVLGLEETGLVQRQVEAVLLVVAHDGTPERLARAAIDHLRGRGAKVAGFVLNREPA